MFCNSNWIHSFPQNYQWSNAILVTKGMAPYGAVAMGEIDLVTQKLHARINEPHAWWEEWSAMADLEKIDGPIPARSGRRTLRFNSANDRHSRHSKANKNPAEAGFV
jgi:hypothetical protein